MLADVSNDPDLALRDALRHYGTEEWCRRELAAYLEIPKSQAAIFIYAWTQQGQLVARGRKRYRFSVRTVEQALIAARQGLTGEWDAEGLAIAIYQSEASAERLIVDWLRQGVVAAGVAAGCYAFTAPAARQAPVRQEPADALTRYQDLVGRVLPALLELLADPAVEAAIALRLPDPVAEAARSPVSPP